MEIRPINLLIFSFGLVLTLTIMAPASIHDQSPLSQADLQAKNDLSFPTLLNRLAILNEPVSREGAGRLVIQAPGERYSLQFRLLAKGPEALRLEIFDPFGRPMLYFVSFLGETRLFSIAQKKEIPFNPSLFGPWSAISQIPIVEMLKIFWGRVPLFPYDTYKLDIGQEEEKRVMTLILLGNVQQELWISPDPFSLTKVRITNPSREGEIEIIFSDFSEVTGNRTPMHCEIKDGPGEHVLTIRYETLVLRADIPDEIFKLSHLSDSPSSEKEEKP